MFNFSVQNAYSFAPKPRLGLVKAQQDSKNLYSNCNKILLAGIKVLLGAVNTGVLKLAGFCYSVLSYNSLTDLTSISDMCKCLFCIYCFAKLFNFLFLQFLSGIYLIPENDCTFLC